jgi:hypothetical protein
VIWVGNNFSGDLAAWGETSVRQYLQAGGNVLLMTRMGSAFLDADLLSYLGISWAATNVTLNTYNSVYPGLVGIAQTAGQTLNDVFSTTLGPNSTLLFSGTGGFTGTRGLGVHAQPPGGGDFRADGGRFVFMSGRPYRMNATSLSTNVEWIVENLFGEPYTPPVAVESPAGPVALQLSRTGYTGEDGFELYHPAKDSAKLWEALMATKAITPVALGCRDSLRLEMGMALYGNDIDENYSPLEAGLGWLVKMKKGDFVGRAALETQKAAGVPRKLVGFTFTEKAIPRHGYPVFVNGEPSGQVMSGIMSPSVGVGLGTCYVPTAHAKEGNTLEVEIRGKRVVGTITPFPFWKKGTVKR